MSPELNLVLLDDDGRPFLVLSAQTTVAVPPGPGSVSPTGPGPGAAAPAAPAREQGAPQ